MTTFEYLAVLFSVVVGLAVTQTLRGLLRIIRHRRSIKLYWPAFIWTAGVLQWTIFFWWFSAFGLAQLDEWHLTTLLFVLTYSSALYFLLGLLHPDDVGEGFDMQAHFNEHKTWFFAVFLCLGLLDVGDTLFKQANEISTLAGRSLVEYMIFSGVWIVGAAISLRARKPGVLTAVGLTFLAVGGYICFRWGGVLGPTLGNG